MAEKKKAPVERKIVEVNGKAGFGGNAAAATGSASGKRITAVILWVLALGAEFLAYALLSGLLYIPGDTTYLFLGALAVDLILVVIASLMWKKANHIDPPSKKEPVKFFLQSQLGAIMAIIAFLPIIFFLLKDKDLDAKTKKMLTAVASVFLVIALLFGIDFSPASAEDLSQAQSESVVLGDGTAYWTRWGHSYHFDPNCQTLRNSEVIYHGTVEDAFAANRTDPCDFCAGGGDAK